LDIAVEHYRLSDVPLGRPSKALVDHFPIPLAKPCRLPTWNSMRSSLGIRGINGMPTGTGDLHRSFARATIQTAEHTL